MDPKTIIRNYRYNQIHVVGYQSASPVHCPVKSTSDRISFTTPSIVLDSLASRVAIYSSFLSNRSLSWEMCSVNVSSLSVRDFRFSTWRNFSPTASLDNSSTNLTSRASYFGPISVVSEVLSPLRLGLTLTKSS